MIVSVCVVAYNEEKSFRKTLGRYQAQDYDHEKMEVVLIDSMSTDSTKEIMERFQQQMTDFKNVQVLKNPGKKQASGWNVAINNFSGDVMIRVDAHASIPPEFVRKNVEILESGEMVSGGPRPNMIDESTPWKETLLLAGTVDGLVVVWLPTEEVRRNSMSNLFFMVRIAEKFWRK